jgi:hypothetical protein
LYVKEEKRRQMWRDIGFAFLITCSVGLILGILGFVAFQAQAYSQPPHIIGSVY